MRRRQLARFGLGAILSALAPTLLGLNARSCAATAHQTEGPFYPVNDQTDKDFDLTMLKGHSKNAQGVAILVQGQVTDTTCKALATAKLELWQANKWGRYQHRRDSNPAPLDPDFQGWGIVQTNSQGRYKFKTIIPGAYPANQVWTRPPHIHFKVSAPGYGLLTTQMYFSGQELNEQDLILKNLTEKQRKSIVVSEADNSVTGLPGYEFNIVLSSRGL